MATSADTADEMRRAMTMLRQTVGDLLPTVTVTSTDADEAVFLGKNISKLSPIIGNQIERRIPLLLERAGAVHGLYWQRQDPDFPDAALFDANGNATGAGFEVKAWYPLATEMTGRFRESQNLLAGKDIHVVVVAWAMSHIVFGTPTIIDILIVPATEIAASRDSKYHNPPDYLCEEPQDTTARARNLQQTNVLGFKMQDTNPTRKAAAEKLWQTSDHRGMPSHTPEGQALTRQLLETATYRGDTNFAKLSRVGHMGVNAFEAKVLLTRIHDRPIRSWMNLLKALDNESSPAQQAAAARVIAELYEKGQL